MKKNDDTKKHLSRRDFVKTTTVGIGGIGATALAGLGAPQAEAAEVPKRWDKVADVVVVGAGAAGLPAHRGRRTGRLRDRYRAELRHRRPRYPKWRRHAVGGRDE